MVTRGRTYQLAAMLVAMCATVLTVSHATAASTVVLPRIAAVYAYDRQAAPTTALTSSSLAAAHGYDSLTQLSGTNAVVARGGVAAEEGGSSLLSRIGARLADETGSIGGYSATRLGAVARRFGITRADAGAAIEALKQDNLTGGTEIRNPDLYIDKAGEAFPIGPGGTLGDSIGNILDYLP
jgi:hypothetical protein